MSGGSEGNLKTKKEKTRDLRWISRERERGGEGEREREELRERGIEGPSRSV